MTQREGINMPKKDAELARYEPSSMEALGGSLNIEMSRKEQTIAAFAQVVERRLMKFMLDARDWYSLLELKQSGAYKEVINKETGKPFTWAEVAAGFGVGRKTADRIIGDIDSFTRPQYEALERSGANIHVIRKLGAGGGKGNARVAKLIQRGMAGEELSKSDWQHVVQTLQSKSDDATERANALAAEVQQKERIIKKNHDAIDKRDLTIDKLEAEREKAKEELAKARRAGTISGSEKKVLDALVELEFDYLALIGKLKKIDFMHSDKTRAKAHGLFETLTTAPVELRNEMAKTQMGIDDD